MEDDTIDWNDISSRSRIPGIILYEFQTKIIWINVIHNTRLTVKSIIQNKTVLLDEFKNNIRVFDNVDDTNFSNILYILKILHDYNINLKLYILACDKKYVNLVRAMLKLYMITGININLDRYILDNNHQIVNIIMEETDLRPTIKNTIRFAYDQNQQQMINVLRKYNCHYR